MANVANMAQQLQQQARHFYQTLPEWEKAEGQRLFNSLDYNGDGYITLEEICQVAGPALSPQILSYFSILDADGNGVLTFWECVTLYYLLKTNTIRPNNNCRVPPPQPRPMAVPGVHSFGPGTAMRPGGRALAPRRSQSSPSTTGRSTAAGVAGVVGRAANGIAVNAATSALCHMM